MLKRLEKSGFKWGVIGVLPTKFRFSEAVLFNGFPYMIGVHEDTEYIGWLYYSDNYKGDVVYDGRTEENMYKVTEDFMNELIKWRNANGLETKTRYMYEAVDGDDIQRIPDVVDIWWTDPDNSIERNKRLIAIIQWLNGEDVFEVEKLHKFVVRSENADKSGDYVYVTLFEGLVLPTEYKFAYIFDTREEAQEWANSHQVVVEIDEEGNEVE